MTDERTVRCPINGCEVEVLARGIHLHVRQSSGDGHGPQGDVPEHINFDDLETVGKQNVEMDYPEERETEQIARLCPYCERPFKGKNGVLIHLGQVAGRKDHPETAGEQHTKEDFPRVEVDEQGNIIRVADDTVSSENVDTDKGGAVPRQRVYYLIAELLADDEVQVARRVRRRLLGVEDVTRPVRKIPPHHELYEELLMQSHADQPDGGVTATLRKDGISIECRGESARYTADEARDIAAGLERDAEEDDEISDLVEWLRHGADLLEGEQPDIDMDFEDWR